MESKVLIYGKGGCPYTDQARSAYGDRAVYVDVKKDASGLQEMLRLSGGKRQVPVIVEGEKVTVGYGGT
jgi:glutaredoxin 3